MNRLDRLRSTWRRLCELLRDQRDVEVSKEQAYALLYWRTEQRA